MRRRSQRLSRNSRPRPLWSRSAKASRSGTPWSRRSRTRACPSAVVASCTAGWRTIWRTSTARPTTRPSSTTTLRLGKMSVRGSTPPARWRAPSPCTHIAKPSTMSRSHSPPYRGRSPGDACLRSRLEELSGDTWRRWPVTGRRSKGTSPRGGGGVHGRRGRLQNARSQRSRPWRTRRPGTAACAGRSPRRPSVAGRRTVGPFSGSTRPTRRCRRGARGSRRGSASRAAWPWHAWGGWRMR